MKHQPTPQQMLDDAIGIVNRAMVAALDVQSPGEVALMLRRHADMVTGFAQDLDRETMRAAVINDLSAMVRDA